MIKDQPYFVAVEKQYCQSFREILGDEKLFDKKRKIKFIDKSAMLPVKGPLSEDLIQKLNTIASFETKILDETGLELSLEPNSRKEKLEKRIKDLLPQELQNPKILTEIPESWEFYGELILLPGNSFTDSIWKEFLPKVIAIICEIFKVKRVARKRSVINDKFRSPKTDILQGDDPWVWRKENGITYHFDITRCMFSAGNISEKIRIANFDCTGETIVDLFAGIGYFTLPYLIHAKAEHVFACEWNPSSVVALKYNLEKLGVTDKCTVLEGDNRLVCPKNVADRVNLGLIPESVISWRTACEALKEKGGILHIHANVDCHRDESKKEKFSEFAANVQDSIGKILQEVKNQPYKVVVKHVECVKSYAPRVYHLVVDLGCSLIQ